MIHDILEGGEPLWTFSYTTVPPDIVRPGNRIAWKSSIPISSGLCRFNPGSVKIGGTGARGSMKNPHRRA
jgi:hypothetical protein